MTKEEVKEIVGTPDFLYHYLTCDAGQRMAVWPNGETGWLDENTTDPNVVWEIRCPGLGNIDSTGFTDGYCHYDEEKEAYVVDDDLYPGELGGKVLGDLEDVIRDAIENGDMTYWMEELQRVVEETWEVTE